MKKLATLVFVSALSCFAQNASAANDEMPLLTRLNTPGFIIPGSGIAQTCALYSNRVVVTLMLDGARSVQTHPISMQGDLSQAIASANKGEITHDIGPTDIPLEIYSAYMQDSEGKAHRIDLGSTDDGAFTHNSAPEARGLKSFLDAHCPAVH